MDIVFIGKKDECVGFSLTGIKTYEVKDEEDFLKTVESFLNRKDTGIVIISDRFFDTFSMSFSEKIKKRAIPVFIFVPSIDGVHMKRRLKEFVKNVLGIGV